MKVEPLNRHKPSMGNDRATVYQRELRGMKTISMRCVLQVVPGESAHIQLLLLISTQKMNKKIHTHFLGVESTKLTMLVVTNQHLPRTPGLNFSLLQRS